MLYDCRQAKSWRDYSNMVFIPTINLSIIKKSINKIYHIGKLNTKIIQSFQSDGQKAKAKPENH